MCFSSTHSIYNLRKQILWCSQCISTFQAILSLAGVTHCLFLRLTLLVVLSKYVKYNRPLPKSLLLPANHITSERHYNLYLYRCWFGTELINLFVFVFWTKYDYLWNNGSDWSRFANSMRWRFQRSDGSSPVFRISRVTNSLYYWTPRLPRTNWCWIRTSRFGLTYKTKFVFLISYEIPYGSISSLIKLLFR